jgi:hypothetical protein
MHRRAGRRNTEGTGGRTTVSAGGGTGKSIGTNVRAVSGIETATATVTRAARDGVTVSAMTDRGRLPPSRLGTIAPWLYCEQHAEGASQSIVD